RSASSAAGSPARSSPRRCRNRRRPPRRCTGGCRPPGACGDGERSQRVGGLASSDKLGAMRDVLVVPVMLVTLAACGGAPGSAAPAAPPPSRTGRRLGSPPPRAGLVRLDAAADAGDAAAGWAHVHILIDLFDAARFGRDEAARRALLGALKVVEGDRARTA